MFIFLIKFHFNNSQSSFNLLLCKQNKLKYMHVHTALIPPLSSSFTFFSLLSNKRKRGTTESFRVHIRINGDLSRPPLRPTICGLLNLYLKHYTSGTVYINIAFIRGILLCSSVRIDTLWIFKHILASGVACNLWHWQSHLCLQSSSKLWTKFEVPKLSWHGTGRWSSLCPAISVL